MAYYKYRVGQKRFKSYSDAVDYAEMVRLDVLLIKDGHACWTINKPMWELVDDEHWAAYCQAIRAINS